ncbi:MAG: flavodoxin family protein [Anaerolineaceae bacterium]|nr:flavodoxin family protein [Anaerolineaceae bacterium]
MKVIAILGSARGNGNTARALNLLETSLRRQAAAAAEPLEFERIELGKMTVEACRGCRVCFDRGESFCPIDDDIPEIKQNMLDADAVIVASPVYVNDVSGLLKNWIDRLAHVCHRPEFFEQSFYLLATTGSSPTRHTLRTLQIAVWSWGGVIAGQAGLNTGALMTPEEMREQHGRTLDRAAQRLLRAVHEKRYEKPGFINLMMFKIQQVNWRRMKDEESLDMDYRRARGWLDPSRAYYIDHSAHPLLLGFARLIGSLVAAIMG